MKRPELVGDLWEFGSNLPIKHEFVGGEAGDSVRSAAVCYHVLVHHFFEILSGGERCVDHEF